jgi:hypothetical protein
VAPVVASASHDSSRASQMHVSRFLRESLRRLQERVEAAA